MDSFNLDLHFSLYSPFFVFLQDYTLFYILLLNLFIHFFFAGQCPIESCRVGKSFVDSSKRSNCIFLLTLSQMGLEGGPVPQPRKVLVLQRRLVRNALCDVQHKFAADHMPSIDRPSSLLENATFVLNNNLHQFTILHY